MTLPVFETIKESEAPKPVGPSANTESMDAYEKFVKSIPAGEVGRIKLTTSMKDGEEVTNFRSIASSARRAAKRAGVEVADVYSRDGYAFIKPKNVAPAAATAPKTNG